MATILEIRNLFASYDYVPVLTGISMQIEEGQIAGLVGRNGVGKSTLLKCILGLVPQQRGKISFKGQDITRESPIKVARTGIGFVPQGRRLFPHLTVAENLDLVPTLKQGHREHRERILRQFEFLRRRLDQLAGTMSGGEQQMVSIARALLLQPSLLLMDEPTEGLDRQWMDEVCTLIKRLRDQGKAVLIVEHDLEVVVRLCDKVFVAHRGSIVYEGFPEDSTSYRDELLFRMGLHPLQEERKQLQEMHEHV